MLVPVQRNGVNSLDIRCTFMACFPTHSSTTKIRNRLSVRSVLARRVFPINHNISDIKETEERKTCTLPTCSSRQPKRVDYPLAGRWWRWTLMSFWMQSLIRLLDMGLQCVGYFQHTPRDIVSILSHCMGSLQSPF